MNTHNFQREAYYHYAFRVLDDGTRVAIVIDSNNKDCVSVTNSVRRITSKLNVQHILYLATDKEWCYWSEEHDFDTLQIKDSVSGKYKPVPTLDIAWAVIKSRYLSKKTSKKN